MISFSSLPRVPKLSTLSSRYPMSNDTQCQEEIRGERASRWEANEREGARGGQPLKKREQWYRKRKKEEEEGGGARFLSTKYIYNN